MIVLILDFLRGKKTSIATIAGALVTYALARNYILPETAELLSTILIALGLSINFSDSYLYSRQLK